MGSGLGWAARCGFEDMGVGKVLCFDSVGRQHMFDLMRQCWFSRAGAEHASGN